MLPSSTVLNGLDCTGPNTSPDLEWSGAPPGTQSYALILDDYEARGGDGFIHWVAYNIPSLATALPQTREPVSLISQEAGRTRTTIFFGDVMTVHVRRRARHTNTVSLFTRSTCLRSTTPALR